MPRRQPFTALCQLTGRGRHFGRADLHLHTTSSDGKYTPEQVIDLARRAGLCAIAITDHDTLEGVGPARAAAEGTGVEVIAGVEITTRHEGRELHLLAYFVDESCPALHAALARIRRDRAERFLEMIERLRALGVSVDPGTLPAAPGRRHLAELLVRSGKVASIREAFARYLRDGGRADVPKQALPTAEALAIVRQAGGVAARAHPPYDCSREDLANLKLAGMAAVETEYPAGKRQFSCRLRGWAAELGLATTGGSDCHGPDSPTIGSHTISAEQVVELRQRIPGV